MLKKHWNPPHIFQAYRAKYTEQSLLFLLILTVVGGYMNGYSFVTRGGSLVTMQSGNMARIGIAAYTHDMELFIVSIIPIVGCLVGCTISYLLRDLKKHSTPIYWQKVSLSAEIALFTLIGFIPVDFHNHIVNFAIAIVSGFQLCSLKSYRGYAHTTTLASGNVRNLGEILASLILKRDAEALSLFLEYFILFISFTVGAILGCIIGGTSGAPAIWLCSFLLFILLIQMYSNRAHEEERRFCETHFHEPPTP